MTKKKMMMAGMSAALVAVIGVGGTLAYLSAQSDVVENSFTVGTGYIPDEDGHTGIWLDETNVDGKDLEGKPNTEVVRDTANIYEELLPGDRRIKDPMVHMVGGSVESYVFVKVDGLKEAAEKGIDVFYTIKQGDEVNYVKGVNPYTFEAVNVDETGDGIYIFKGAGSENYVVDVTDESQGSNVVLGTLFDTIQFDEDVNEVKEGMFDGRDITIQACAVQAAESMDSYEDAMATLPAEWFE